MVGRARFELATNRLRGDCSTAELATRIVKLLPSSQPTSWATLTERSTTFYTIFDLFGRVNVPNAFTAAVFINARTQYFIWFQWTWVTFLWTTLIEVNFCHVKDRNIRFDNLKVVILGPTMTSNFNHKYAQGESDPHHQFRRLVLYPLSYRRKLLYPRLGSDQWPLP